MKDGIILESKDVKCLIAKCLNIKEEQVVATKYSFMIMGVSKEELEKLIKA